MSSPATSGDDSLHSIASSHSSIDDTVASTTSRSAAETDDIWRQSRLSLPDVIRIPIAIMASFTVGMGLGAAQGSTMAGLRFRAEHAHKLPQTTTGWYLYHKSKNYHVAYGGIREGLRMGGKVSFWTTAIFGIETLFDKYRGTMDLVNTVLACVTAAGGFSLWSMCQLDWMRGMLPTRLTKRANRSMQTDSRLQQQPEQLKQPLSWASLTVPCRTLLELHEAAGLATWSS